MVATDGSTKIIDVLKNQAPEACPVCGEKLPGRRIFGGVKNGKDAPFDNRVICPVCGTDLTAEENQTLKPLDKTDAETIRILSRRK